MEVHKEEYQSNMDKNVYPRYIVNERGKPFGDGVVFIEVTSPTSARGVLRDRTYAWEESGCEYSHISYLRTYINSFGAAKMMMIANGVLADD